MTEYLPVAHPRFTKVERSIFERRMVSDCIAHECRFRAGGRHKPDACCGYGADADLTERDAILAHKAEISALMHPRMADRPWFSEELNTDEDFPSGTYVRIEAYGRGRNAKCIFRYHDGRGCAIHRAAIENGWDLGAVKPHVCRLFPLTYETDAIVLSDDYPAYSCAYDAGAPTVYRGGRDTLAEVFGAALVAALDAVEAQVLGRRGLLRVL